MCHVNVKTSVKENLRSGENNSCTDQGEKYGGADNKILGPSNKKKRFALFSQQSSKCNHLSLQ